MSLLLTFFGYVSWAAQIIADADYTYIEQIIVSYVHLFFLYLSWSAQVIADVDYVYVEWIISLYYPHLKFLFVLFLVPAVMITVMFLQNLFIILTKIYIHVMKVRLRNILYMFNSMCLSHLLLKLSGNFYRL